jgi:PAS domain S-box-containing protein
MEIPAHATAIGRRPLNGSRAITRVEQHEKETRALIDTIPQQIWSAAADGTMGFRNERWRSYVGLSLEELKGTGWQSLLHPDDRERALKAWQDSVADGTPYEQEERHRGPTEITVGSCAAVCRCAMLKVGLLAGTGRTPTSKTANAPKKLCGGARST